MESPLSGSYEPLSIEASAVQLVPAETVTLVHSATGGWLQIICNSNAPMSVPSPTFAIPGSSKVRGAPVWSVAAPVKLVPWSMAGLPHNSACVGVWPPFNCNGPNFGSVLIWSVEPSLGPVPSLLRL